jgi:hypothetical protein
MLHFRKGPTLPRFMYSEVIQINVILETLSMIDCNNVPKIFQLVSVWNGGWSYVLLLNNGNNAMLIWALLSKNHISVRLSSVAETRPLNSPSSTFVFTRLFSFSVGCFRHYVDARRGPSTTYGQRFHSVVFVFTRLFSSLRRCTARPIDDAWTTYTTCVSRLLKSISEKTTISSQTTNWSLWVLL